MFSWRSVNSNIPKAIIHLMMSKSSGCKLIVCLFLRCCLTCLMKAIGVTCLYSWNSSTNCSLENPLLFVSWVQPRVWSKFSVIQTHNSSSLLALEALSGDRFFVVERMRFSSDRSICSVWIPICGWWSYIFPFVFLQVYFGNPPILCALSITNFDVSRSHGSAAALDV